MTIVTQPAREVRSARSPLTFQDAWLTLPVCAIAALAVFVLLLVPQSNADPDIGWHLRNADIQLRTGTLLTRDLFSFTANRSPWIDHEWLAEIPFYLGWRRFGPCGVFLVTALAIETILLVTFYLAYRKSGSLVAALSVSLAGALLSTVSFGPRTLLFGWICLVAELLVLEEAAQRPRLLYALPPLFTVWVNIHGSWLIGLVVLAVFLAANVFRLHAGAIDNIPCSPCRRRTLLNVFALSFAGLFVNPYGWRLVAYPFNLAFHQRLNIANLEEWRTLDFHTPRGRLMLAILALLFVAQLLRRRPWTLVELGFLAIGICSALAYSRFLFLFAILAMPILAKDVASLLPSPAIYPAANKPLLNAALLFVLFSLLARNLPRAARIEEAWNARYPVQAAAYLERMQPKGNVFNDFLWGGFLIWHAPHTPVFIDSRVDIFEYTGVFRDYLDAVRLKNSLAILDKYKIRFVVFPTDAPLVYLLEHTSGWKMDYQDGTAVVLERASLPCGEGPC